MWNLEVRKYEDRYSSNECATKGNFAKRKVRGQGNAEEQIKLNPKGNFAKRKVRGQGNAGEQDNALMSEPLRIEDGYEEDALNEVSLGPHLEVG